MRSKSLLNVTGCTLFLSPSPSLTQPLTIFNPYPNGNASKKGDMKATEATELTSHKGH